MDAATLREAMVGHLTGAQRRRAELPAARYAALAPACDAALIQAGCTTIRRAAMWCAQLGHESVGLAYMSEIWGPTKTQLGYEGRRDLGNTRPGDGRKYAGHGPIQITGRGNHTAVSRWAFDHGYVPTPTYFVDRPEELGSDRYGFLGAVWYWTVARVRINAMCDAADLDGVTKAINGGLNGLDDRRARWNACLRLGAALLPSARPQEDDMPSVDDVWRKPIPDQYTPNTADSLPADIALSWAVAHAARALDASLRCEKKLDEILAKLGQR